MIRFSVLTLSAVSLIGLSAASADAACYRGHYRPVCTAPVVACAPASCAPVACAPVVTCRPPVCAPVVHRYYHTRTFCGPRFYRHRCR